MSIPLSIAEQIIFAQQNAMFLAEKVRKMNVFSAKDLYCFATVLYNPSNDYAPIIRVITCKDWLIKFNFTCKPGFRLTSDFRQIAEYIRLCILHGIELGSVNISSKLLPSILSMSSLNNTICNENIAKLSSTEIMVRFSKVFSTVYVSKTLQLCGDVESNPGPFSSMLVEQLIANDSIVKKNVWEREPVVNTMSKYYMKHLDLKSYWSAASCLAAKIKYLPRFGAHVRYEHTQLTAGAFRLDARVKYNDRVITSKHVEGLATRPITIHSTSVEKALRILSSTGAGIWVVPVYDYKPRELLGSYMHTYVRTDGKNISLVMNVVDEDLVKKNLSFVNIADIQFVFPRYIGYCATLIYNDRIINGKRKCYYSDIIDETWMCIKENSIIHACLNSTTKNRIVFNVTCRHFDYNLIRDNLCLNGLLSTAVILRVPIRSLAFYNWHDAHKEIYRSVTFATDSLHWGEYGVGAPVSFGRHEKGAMDKWVDYFGVGRDLLGVQLPCNSEHFLSLCYELFGILTLQPRNYYLANFGYGELHCLRAFLTYGLYRIQESYPIPRIKVCPLCHAESSSLSFDSHCFSKNNKTIVLFMRSWTTFEGIFNYWLQKILNISRPDWNSLLYFNHLDIDGVVRDYISQYIDIELAQPTMGPTPKQPPAVIRMTGMSDFYAKSMDIATCLEDQLATTGEMLGAVKDKDIISRTDSLLTRIEDALPILEGQASFTDYIDILDGFLCKQVFACLRWLNPLMLDEDMPKIKFSLILRDYVLLKNVKNSAIKLMIILDMLKQAGIYDILYKFYTNYTSFIDQTDKPTSGILNFTTWILELFSKPWEWAKNATVFIGGLVSSYGVEYNPKHLLQWIAKMAPSFRHISMITNGLQSIGTICKTLLRYYYLAKEYVFKFLGIKCVIPMYVKIRDHAANWSSAVMTLCMPNYVNTIMTSEEAWPVVDDVSSVGFELLKDVPSGPLGQMVVNGLRDLGKLQARINWKRGINSAAFSPFVIHLNGPPNMGKSAIVQQICEALGKTLRIPDRFYSYNELGKWFDGYAQEHFICVDDVNLSKEPESIAWLIKLVSTNLCILPVAENETRPSISNCKVLILTSNCAYSPVVGMSTTKGIDRRSRFKFDVSSKFYDEKTTSINERAKDFSWVNVHKFVRIPSVSTDGLLEEDRFEGNNTEFLEYICAAALEHTNKERERIKNSSHNWIPHNESEQLRLKLLDGITPGNEKIDLEVIKEAIAQMPFVTRDTFVWGANTTVLSPEELQRIKAIASLYTLDPSKDFSKEVSQIFQSVRYAKSYPRLDGNVIRFDSSKPEETQPQLETLPLGGSMFQADAVRLDYYFLHHLRQSDEGFHIEDFYRRNDFTHKLVKPSTAVLDFYSYQTLITDASFMSSWSTFFSLTPTHQGHIYTQYVHTMTTYRYLVANRVTFMSKISKVLSRIFCAQTATTFFMASYGALCSLAAVALGVELISRMFGGQDDCPPLEPFEGFTSNAPRPPKGSKSGVQSTFTAGAPASDTGFSNALEKALPNMYLAFFKDEQSQNMGVFNLVFVFERFALIPAHVISGTHLERDNRDFSRFVIHIWSEFHGAFLRYTFTKDHACRIQGKDSIVIHIPDFRASKSILGLWARELLDDKFMGLPIQTSFQSSSGMQHVHSNLVSLDPVTNVSGRLYPCAYDLQYLVSNRCPAGSSGGLVFLNSTKIQTKIIGTQSSTHQNCAHVQAILRQDILDAVKIICDRIGLRACLPKCDVPYDESYDEAYPNLIGKVTSGHAVTISPKTQLKRSPWFGKIYDPPDRQPVFQLMPREEQYNYVNKTEQTALKPFNPALLALSVSEYSNYLKSFIYNYYKVKRPISILSLDQSLNGDYIGGKPFDLTTSPGIGIGDWIHNRKSSGQHDFIGYDGEKYFAKPMLTEAVSTVLSQSLTGNLKTSTYASFPKDELRPLLKDARGIDGSPIEQKVLYRMLFGRLDGLLSFANKGQMKYGLGINLFSPAGTHLISRMTDKVFAWDFSKFDGCITYQMYQAVTDIYNELSCGDEYTMARHALSYATCHATIIADHGVYQPNKGMRSGFGGTSSFNTHIHNLFIILAVKSLIQTSNNLCPSLQDVFEVMDWIAYGDDCVAWLKEPDMADKINGETIALVFESFGLIVKDPRGKTSLPPKFVHITEATFLKQSPYFDETLNLPLWRCQDDCLSSVFNYYSGDDFTESLDSAFHMLWPYGREKFEECRDKINLILQQHRKVYTKSWNSLREQFMREFEGTEYSGQSSYFATAYRERESLCDLGIW
nr:MAG: RNA-dependent RNA polymerase [Wufeng shrew polycipivirus 4]